MWQCRRCDSEVDERVPGCARCPFPVDTSALAHTATGSRIAEARAHPEAAKATDVVAAAVIGARYYDTVNSKGIRSVNYYVDLAFADRPARSTVREYKLLRPATLSARSRRSGRVPSRRAPAD